MNRATASISLVLGAGFSTLSTTITNLTVYDGGLGLITLLPVTLGLIIAADEFRDRDDDDELPDGLTSHEIKHLKEGADA